MTFDDGVQVHIDPQSGAEQLIMPLIRKRPRYEASIFVSGLPSVSFLSDSEYRKILDQHFSTFAPTESIKIFPSPQARVFNGFVVFQVRALVTLRMTTEAHRCHRQSEADAMRIFELEDARKLVLPINREVFTSNLKMHPTQASTRSAQIQLHQADSQRTIGLRFACAALPSLLRFKGVLMPHGFDSYGRPRFREHRILDLVPAVANAQTATIAVQTASRHALQDLAHWDSADAVVELNAKSPPIQASPFLP